MSSKIDSRLKNTLRRYRKNDFDLLLRVDEVDEENEEDLAARGISIRHRLILTPTYAITCTGQEGLGLLDVPWICRIDEDQRVFTQ